MLQHPHEEFSAVALIADDAIAADSRTSEAEALTVGGASDAGEVLDPQAKAAYRCRLHELQEELADAQQRADQKQIATLQYEIDFLTQELSSAVGLGGRSRKAVSTSERARLNVTRAIRRALQKITARHITLSDYLSRTIKTSNACSYRSDPYSEVQWQF